MHLQGLVSWVVTLINRLDGGLFMNKLNFGKYKGLSLREVSDFDFQYILWCMKNIRDFENKLSNEDKITLKYIVNPFDGINTNSISYKELVSLLKQRGIIKSCNDYVNSNNDIVLKLETIYGICHHYESVDNMFYDLKSVIVKHIDRWIKKFFQ
jgi:hypothetical protein